ncbi:MAG TPA: hypothetical protein DCS93_11300 [Microscillaceae bacterium]|nr:hypothetical protein [Microscillaceae bacterium]
MKISVIICLGWLLVMACTQKKQRIVNNPNGIDTVAAVAISDTPAKKKIYRTCHFSSETFALSIDSCNCGEIKLIGDTVLVHLSPFVGGEVQQRWLKINKPTYDGSFYLLKKHQNRMYMSSMGPDPILDDWILYNSSIDTIHYDHQRKGFYIETITEKARTLFPKFDTLELYKAYKRSVGRNLKKDYVPDMAKNALYREFKEIGKELVLSSAVELHSIILLLKRKNTTLKTVIFVYEHFG